MTEALFSDAKLVELPAGARVFQPGDPCSMFVVLKSGRIRVDLISNSGKPVTLYHFGAGETCVLTTSCLLSGDDLCGEANVVDPVSAYVYSPAEFDQKLNTSPEFRKFVFQAFAERLSRMMAKIDAVLTEPIETRLASALLDRFANSDKAHATQDELARDVGTAREVVSRKIALWRKEGILETSRGTFTLKNKARLLEISALRD